MFPAIVTSLFGYCAIALQQLEANMIKHTTQQPALEAVSRDGRGGGEGVCIRQGGDGEWDESVGVCVSSAARCLFPSQSPKQQPTVPKTAQEAPSMTIRHHLQTLQLPPVILLSFSVNYTNHFLQDGSLGCQPGNLSFLYLRLSEP